MFFVSPMVVNVLGFKINTIDNGAVANMGTLQLVDQFVTYKRNQAFGEQNGDLSPVAVPAPQSLTPMSVIVMPLKTVLCNRGLETLDGSRRPKNTSSYLTSRKWKHACLRLTGSVSE